MKPLPGDPRLPVDVPESTATHHILGEALTSYSFSMANTFVNTQGSTRRSPKQNMIGGVASDFNSADTGQAVPNLGLYMDVESYRQNFRFRSMGCPPL